MMYSLTQRQNPLNREEEAKFYATPEYGEVVDIHQLASEISKSCTLTPADIVAVIESLLEKMPFYLKNSNRIRLDNFGIFKLSFKSKGQKDEKDVSASDISNLHVLFTPSVALKKELSDVSYTKK